MDGSVRYGTRYRKTRGSGVRDLYHDLLTVGPAVQRDVAPAGVCRIALDTRFPSDCRSRTGSTVSAGSSAVSAVSVTPAASALPLWAMST
jgi:hypothetical protein